MKPLLISSTRTHAGKTTVGLGIAMNTDMKVGYFKPYGDHLVYSKKNLIDLDTQVFNEWLGLDDKTNMECCLGFDPEKIMSHWIHEEVQGVLRKMYDQIAEDRDLVLIESCRNFSYGGIMGLDSITVAQTLGADMILVAEGDVELLVDKALAVSRCLENKANLRGVIINKCDDNDKFRLEDQGLQVLMKAGIEVLGILPRQPLLNLIDIDLILNKLNAKLVAGTEGEMRPVETILIGALTADQAMKTSKFHTENKLIITGGDRLDLIFASLGEGTAGIVLTNNILPHPKVIAKADEMNIPVMSVPMDTFTTATAVHHIIAEIRPEDEEKKTLIKEMAAQKLDMDKIMEE
jgi:BioD-like phosphotransacetylase family protein